MRVFVTGATGFIGSAVVRELRGAGHEVLGLARSAEAATALTTVGADVLRGDLSDLESLRVGARGVDGVIHTAYNHDFSVDRLEAAEADRQAIAAMGEVLAGSGRPLLITSGTGRRAPGQPATEDTDPDVSADMTGRSKTELVALAFAERGVRACVVRFPPSVHGRGDRGFVPQLINIARSKGFSGYPGEGVNRWPAVHRLDAAHLFRRALESAPAASRLHGVGDEGIAVRDIAEAIGHGLGMPVRSVAAADVVGHFGFLGPFFSLDLPASSTLTQALLHWKPAQLGLLPDLREGHYFEPVPALRS